jgi:hypothetical protein
MTDQKDIYRSACLIIKQHGCNAEPWALDKMQDFMDVEDVAAASAWLMIAQAIHKLQKLTPSGTIH